MRNTLTALSLVALLPAGAALAGGDDCSVPRDQWQPREAAMQMAREKGWSVRDFEVDDGCYEIEGRDSEGRKIEVKLDPSTLAVIEMERDDDDRNAAANPAPASKVAPPKNGLFSNGTPPKVKVN